MSSEGRPAVATLEAALGHSFADRALLDRARTHRSATTSDAAAYERLEFLGDRVLALAVCDLLMTAFPDEAEGPLSKRLHALVSQDTLAEIAREIDLGPHLRLGGGEDDAAGRDNPAILADVVEALIAALYRDGGMAAAARFVGRYWGERVQRAPQPPKDPKSGLQEWAMARGLDLPAYRTLDSRGPAHAPVFTIEVAVPGHPPERAEGASKRAAERAAAERLLARLAGETETGQ